jgi:ankyrin repeat protein
MNTAMHVAASSEALASIMVLNAFNANINAKNKWGETPFMVCSKFGHVETTKLLVENLKVDLFEVNKENANVLYCVVLILDLGLDYLGQKLVG